MRNLVAYCLMGAFIAVSPLALGQSKIETTLIGVPLLNIQGESLSAVELRDRLVDAINGHQDQALSLRAIRLSSLREADAVVEARDKNCKFVLDVRLQAMQRAKTSRESSSVAELDTALLQYELRRAKDGSVYALGTAKSGASGSVAAAVLDAIKWIPNRVTADLKSPEIYGGAEKVGELTPTLPTPSKTGKSGGPCAWPRSIPHEEALRGACRYAVTQPERMPNFMCRQETSRFLGSRHTPTDLVTATIRYVDGEESYSDIKRNGMPVRRDVEPGWTLVERAVYGQFAGNLRSRKQS